jgi:predicted phage terminase large subunit-like protein
LLLTKITTAFPARAGMNRRIKLARMSIQSAKFEARQVFFPKAAPWLAALEAELFSFPGGRHDDQIDSVSQALANITGGYDSTLSWVR